MEKTLVQNILNLEQIIDDDSKPQTITQGESFQPLGLFGDPCLRKYNLVTLLYGNPRPSFTCSYQKIVQVELTSVNKKFAYYIANIYFKTIKILIHYIYFWC